ncbi:hypothetical protein [Pseudonocardia spinosispora]|nr:hypothetical protein [Pseudonocardia spinosispora]
MSGLPDATLLALERSGHFAQATVGPSGIAGFVGGFVEWGVLDAAARR